MDILSLTDERIANMWIKQAEETGDAKDCYNVGLLYLSCQGVEVDIESAIYWFFRAAIQGDVEAMNNLGILYGQQRDFVGATRWLRRAAEAGDQMAGRNLTKCLEMMGKE
ncbi:MAG: sel1 repeat family protein [Chlorobium sp.]|nr:sel1 repeat family protein [Chlorobium sp.]